MRIQRASCSSTRHGSTTAEANARLLIICKTDIVILHHNHFSMLQVKPWSRIVSRPGTDSLGVARDPPSGCCPRLTLASSSCLTLSESASLVLSCCLLAVSSSSCATRVAAFALVASNSPVYWAQTDAYSGRLLRIDGSDRHTACGGW